ncbi:MAG: glycoside hydrolase family 3 C-terminal domain-containing protein [Lachnospiraceae bacterium]|nr:glycoside hydrolase family 3 C-terminal domain-containing protein [Lachnospiraceae bacterium]
MTELQLKELLADMSLGEKIEQLIQFHGGFYGDVKLITGPGHDYTIKPDQQWRIGTVLGEAGYEHLKNLQDGFMEKQPHHIPTIFMSDVIHGYKTIFPVPLGQGAGFDPELTRELAEATAKEASAAGLHVTFSPMCDLSRDARWGRCMEGTGEDPWLNARFAEAMVLGYQGDGIEKQGNIAACVKHFAAYGAATAGRDYSGVELCERTLLEDYLPSYEAAVKAGAPLVMSAFNTINRIPCSTNKWLLRKILREQMGFDGVVISDYGAVQETVVHTSSCDKADAAAKALKAGVDIDMMSDCYLSYLEEQAEANEELCRLIDESCLRVLELKNKLGLFEHPIRGSKELEDKYFYCEEHKELSVRAARESATLLKNDGLLPLSKNSKIVVAGKLATSTNIVGSWAIFAEADKTVTFADAVKRRYPEADVEVYPCDEADEALLAACKTCDAVILCIGEEDDKTGESKSISDVSLCKAHQTLFDAVYGVNKNTLSLIYAGRPLAIPMLAEKSKAILDAWYPGTFGNIGIWELLFGDANPCGRVPMSFPYTTGQLPMSYSAFITGRPIGEWKGFVPFASNYMDVPNTALYPFGWGLSYSEFAYSPVSLSSDTLTADGKITASVTVANKGSVDGKEPVQLYIRDVKGSVIRPCRELKGLRKPMIRAGESVTVSFEITADMLRFYNEDMEFVAEPGEFQVWIGGSSLTENGAAFRLV